MPLLRTTGRNSMDQQKEKKAKPTRLDYWQLGNKAARERGPGLVTAATMKTLPEVRGRLQTHGWVVLTNLVLRLGVCLTYA